VDVCLQTSGFDAKRIHTVSKNGVTILANNLRLFICSTTTGFYDDTCNAVLLSLSFMFITTKTKQQQTLKTKIVTSDIRENPKFMKNNSRYKVKIISTK